MAWAAGFGYECAPMPTTVPARVLLRAAFTLLVIAAGTSLWATLARQAPGSPLYLGMLPGPIEALRDSALWIGLVFLGVAYWLPALAQGNAALILVGVACVGALLELGAGLYAAIHGLHAIQLKDPRPDVGPIVALKYAGQALLALTLLEITRRAFTRR